MSETNGLIIVFTGEGKGKTTAAMGMALRACGQGMKVLLLQFIKSGQRYGELNAVKYLPGIEMVALGTGFVKNSPQDKMVEHRAAAREAIQRAREEVSSGKWDMIILDEINYAVDFGLIKEEEVLELLEAKPDTLHLVLTGRYVRDTIVEKAHLVTEMKKIKHAYNSGIKAQKGVEF